MTSKLCARTLTGKLLLIDFWATWCGPCRAELPTFETMYRMYGHRAFDLVTVAINYPDEMPGVLKVLQGRTRHQHQSWPGLNRPLCATSRIRSRLERCGSLHRTDPPRGEIVYKVQGGNVDPLKLKRLIIANLADDDYQGHSAYWKSAIDAQK